MEENGVEPANTRTSVRYTQVFFFFIILIFLLVSFEKIFVAGHGTSEPSIFLHRVFVSGLVFSDFSFLSSSGFWIFHFRVFHFTL